MKYEVLRREACDELVEAVNSYLNIGWETIGGISVTLSRYEYESRKGPTTSEVMIWAQAIVKRE